MNYAATDPLGRWTGLGRPLHALEVDYNFYNHETRITAVEASVSTAVSIADITQPTATSILITMSNAASYTVTLPTSTFVDRGAWLPLTAYFVNDTLTANGSLYRALRDHTSAASFDPAANDGAGHDYYAAMMSSPGNALPTGGGTGMMLKKSSGADYAVSWGYALPNGGTAGQVLAKVNATDQNYAWITLSATKVSFAPSTASGLSSTNVAAALEEIEANIPASAAALSFSPSTASGLISTNVAAALEEIKGDIPAGAAQVSFHPSTASGLSSTNVADALDELGVRSSVSSSGSGVQKGDGSGGFAAATAGVDFGRASVDQNSKSADYTTVLSDAGKHLYHPSTDANARTFTIDSNANVAYPVGTAITFVNETSQVVTIAITSDTLVLAGTGSTGSRSLAQYGVATALKVGATRWYISGSGLT